MDECEVDEADNLMGLLQSMTGKYHVQSRKNLFKIKKESRASLS